MTGRPQYWDQSVPLHALILLGLLATNVVGKLKVITNEVTVIKLPRVKTNQETSNKGMKKLCMFKWSINNTGGYYELSAAKHISHSLLKYSRASVMWTPKGRTKSVHISKVSTHVKLGVATGHGCITVVQVQTIKGLIRKNWLEPPSTGELLSSDRRTDRKRCIWAHRAYAQVC